jgi:type I restriction enzyme R subunit
MTSPERQLEEELLGKLRGLKYEHRTDIRDRDTLERNFREKFQALNHVRLTDGEFQRLLEEIITPDVFTAAHTLRDRNAFTRDDGTPLNFTLVNITDWCKNTFEVVNQLRINTDNSHHRFDVILLINGVPTAQVELKTLGINPRRAIEQIVEYKNDPGNGYTRTLLCFVQLFIVSNRDSTYYFANNNARHFAFDADERFLPIYQYARPDNSKVNGLHDFAGAFLAKCTLGQMISRYMVLVASEQKLLMMRPYQIYAVKNIVECIDKNSGNGYVWHTTGSGKTLTSFKASTLLKANDKIDKCLFVVDRKDLDRQTREEFNRFQEGCVEENTNTETLVRRLLSGDGPNKVIVTTIQKLGLALDGTNRRNFKQRLEPLRNRRMVFIFDECHRSQFGDNHQAIREFFPNAQLFGFTGTPIFEANSTYKRIEGDVQTLKTTADLFQKSLHEYTITHAIEDGNVLRFHVDYYKPEGKEIKPGETLAKRAVIDAILEKHDAATGGRRFNALQAFIDTILGRMIFDGEQLTELLAPPGPRLEGPHAKGTGPDGRPRPTPEKTRRRPRHLRPEGLRGVSKKEGLYGNQPDTGSHRHLRRPRPANRDRRRILARARSPVPSRLRQVGQLPPCHLQGQDRLRGLRPRGGRPFCRRRENGRPWLGQPTRNQRHHAHPLRMLSRRTKR